MKEVLKYIGQKLNEIELPYEYYEWTGDDVYPYFVGSYVQEQTREEDGYTHGVFTIDGWARGNILELVKYGDAIKKIFTDHRAFMDGHFLYMNTDNIQTIPTGEEELKRINISISVDEWEENTWD